MRFALLYFLVLFSFIPVRADEKPAGKPAAGARVEPVESKAGTGAKSPETGKGKKDDGGQKGEKPSKTVAPGKEKPMTGPVALPVLEPIDDVTLPPLPQIVEPAEKPGTRKTADGRLMITRVTSRDGAEQKPEREMRWISGKWVICPKNP